MRNLNLNLNIKLSPTPEFLQLVSTLIEGLSNLTSSESNPTAPFIEVEEEPTPVVKPQPRTTAKAKVASKVVEEPRKAVEATQEVEEENQIDLSAEGLRKLVISKTTTNAEAKGVIAKALESLGVKNISALAELSEDKIMSFYQTVIKL
jgi:hypothetical protein